MHRNTYWGPEIWQMPSDTAACGTVKFPLGSNPPRSSYTAVRYPSSQPRKYGSGRVSLCVDDTPVADSAVRLMLAFTLNTMRIAPV